MKLSRQTKIGVVIVLAIAAVLQVVTYVKYSKIQTAVADFHESLTVAQDETEAQKAYEIFYDQTTPLLKAQKVEAGRKWYCAWLCSKSSNTVNPRTVGGYVNTNTLPKTPSSSSTNIGGQSGGGSGGGGTVDYERCVDKYSVFYCDKVFPPSQE